jgi:RNA polymerase sigma factor (sigma-70 family)
MSGVDYVGFRIFYFEESESVGRYACLLDPENGNDLAAEAFTRALARWPDVSGYKYPAAWVRRVVLNLHISGLRRRRLETALGFRGSGGGDIADSVVDSVVISRALNDLSPRQRAALILRFYEGQSFNDVARSMGCSISTANKHVRRGLARLRLDLDVAAYAERVIELDSSSN